MLIAQQQQTTLLESDQLISAICLGCWEKIVHYWSDPDQLEEALDYQFLIHDSRYYYWSRLYKKDEVRRRSGGSEIWIYSPDCESIQKRAIDFAVLRSRSKNEYTATLQPEDILLAAIELDSQTGKKLMASGVDVNKLISRVKAGGTLDSELPKTE